MKIAERATPVAAMIAALSTLACCLPFSFVGALGLASLSVIAAKYRLWLLTLAVLLLLAGGLQLYRGRTSCDRRSRVSVLISGPPFAYSY
ncbi:MAG: hypothetical protein M3O09_17630 [Acidobacteriota bacterium]|nr:hypothetical protein [Acidobacteriota bacterium]